MLSSTELKELREYLNNKDEAVLSYPHTKTLETFSINDSAYAYLETGASIWRLSLRCDPGLSKYLKDKYEEVLAGDKLDKRHWITIILSGQLTYDELTALIDHSYDLAKTA